MASITEALVSGASERVKSSVKDAKDHVVNQFDPRQSIYQLGLGIGPLIRQTVSEYNKQQKNDTKKSSDDQVRKLGDIEKVSNHQDKLLQKATAQLSSMNSLLRDIRKINIAQMQMQAKFAGRTGGQQKSAMAMAASVSGSIGKSDAAAPATPADGDMQAGNRSMKEAISSFMGSDIGSVLKVVVGGLAAGEIWKNLDDDTKDLIKEGVTQIGKELLDGTIELWQAAFKAAPVATIAATAIAANMTGLIGAAFGAWKLGSGLYQLGKGASNVIKHGKWGGVAAAGGVAATEGVAATMPPPAPQTAPVEEPQPQMSRQERRKLEMEKYQELKNQGMKPAEAREAAKEYVKNQSKAPPTPAATPTPKVTPVEGAAAGGGKWAKLGRGAMRLGGGMLAGLGIYGSYESYKDNKKKGNNNLAILDAISGITGAAALGLAATGVGVIPGAILGGVSMATGAASAIGSMFVDDKPKEEKPKPKPIPVETPSGTQPNDKTDATGSLSKLKWGDLSAAQQEALLTAQQEAEGYSAKGGPNGKGTRSYRNNNPGNIEYGNWAIKHGAIGSDGRFAIFKSYADGRAAQRALWESGGPKGSQYKNLSIEAALKQWHGEKTGAAKVNYEKKIASAIGAPGSVTNNGTTNPTAADNKSSSPEIDFNRAASGSFTAEQLKDLKDKDGILAAFGDIASMLPEMLAGAISGSDKPAEKKSTEAPQNQSKATVNTPTPSTNSQAPEKQSLNMHNGGYALQPRILVT